MQPRSCAARRRRGADIIEMWKKIIRAKAVSIMSFAALAFAAGGWLWAYFALRGATAQTPLILHFNDLSGITAVGGMGSITFMGILGVVVALLNFFVALELDGRDRFLGKLAAAATLVFAALLFIAFAAIINVN